MPLIDEINPQLLARIAPRTNLTNRVLERLNDYEGDLSRTSLHDEQVWTLLFTYGFVASDNIGDLNHLSQELTGGQESQTGNLWLEMLPVPARQGISGESERNSEIDVALGDISMREATVSGVKYASPDGREGWVGFVEAKWLSDLGYMTAHDWGRNQLLRVIETALTFQGDGNLPDRIHVTLLTPRVFTALPGNRLYAYKMREYMLDGDRINRDVMQTEIDNSRIERRASTKDWTYPELESRFERLCLHWVTYEDLWEKMPNTPFKAALSEFVSNQSLTPLRL